MARNFLPRKGRGHRGRRRQLRVIDRDGVCQFRAHDRTGDRVRDVECSASKCVHGGDNADHPDGGQCRGEEHRDGEHAAERDPAGEDYLCDGDGDGLAIGVTGIVAANDTNTAAGAGGGAGVGGVVGEWSIGERAGA